MLLVVLRLTSWIVLVQIRDDHEITNKHEQESDGGPIE
jgi:hypothetical protein